MSNDGFPVKSAIIGVASLIVLMLVISLMPFTTVSTGHVGLVREFNAYQGKNLSPGFHFIVPFKDDVIEVNVQTQAYEMSGVESYTKEGQVVTLRGTVQYHIDQAAVGNLFTETGLDFENKLIRKFSEEEFKNAVSQFTAIEIPTNRSKIAEITEGKIRERLMPYHIIVDDFAYGNEDYSDDYEAAIRSRQVQEQRALEAKNLTATEEENKKQEILKAQAVAEKTRLEVEAMTMGGGDAYIRKLNAEAAKTIAEAQLEFARKSNGSVPQQLTIVSGNGDMPTIPWLPLK